MSALHLRGHFLKAEMAVTDLRQAINRNNNGQYTHVLIDLDDMLADLAVIEQRVREEDTL